MTIQCCPGRSDAFVLATNPPISYSSSDNATPGGGNWNYILIYTIYGSDHNSGPLTSQNDVSWLRPYFWRPYTFVTIATGISSH